MYRAALSLCYATGDWYLQVENEDLIFTLETLVERFDEEMAPYAAGLTQHLAAAFWRMQVQPCSCVTTTLVPS